MTLVYQLYSTSKMALVETMVVLAQYKGHRIPPVAKKTRKSQYLTLVVLAPRYRYILDHEEIENFFEKCLSVRRSVRTQKLCTVKLKNG